MHVAIYVRVSTPNQVQAQTIDQQLERLRAHAAAQGWDVAAAHIFRDDGYSGATLRRPGLDHLRDAIGRGAVDLVLLTDPDRLARNYVHQVLLLEEVQAQGCRLEFLDRPMSQDPHDQLLLQIRGAVAEYERTLIAERMRRGRRMKMEAGLLLPWTTPPFGYRLHPDRPRDPAGVWVEAAEAAVVADLFAWYAEEGRSLFGLAKRLQERGVRSPRGHRRWNDSTIRGILTNPSYLGTVYTGRTRYRMARIRRSAVQPIGRPARSFDLRPRAEWTLVATIPALVPQELFDRVQAKLARNRSFAPRNNTTHPYLLRALVSCGLCRLSCVGRWEGAARKGYAYYTCKGKGHALNSGRDERCPGRFIPVAQLDDLVWADLCTVLTHPAQITQALERAHGGAWAPQEVQARRETLRKARAGLTQQTERLTEAYLGGVILLDEYRRRRAEFEERLTALDAQARQMERQMARHTDIVGLTRSITDFCARVRQGLEQATFEQKRQLVELLIDRVVVTGADVEIRYVIPTSLASEHVRFCYLRTDYFEAEGDEPILKAVFLGDPPPRVRPRHLDGVDVVRRCHNGRQLGHSWRRRRGRGHPALLPPRPALHVIGEIPGQKYSERGVRRLLERYADAAGLEHNVSPHQLRHFLLTWLKKQGIDDALIQPYSGHATRKSLEIYSRLAIGEARNEYNSAIGRLPV